jgi:hypothetical protein
MLCILAFIENSELMLVVIMSVNEFWTKMHMKFGNRVPKGKHTALKLLT